MLDLIPAAGEEIVKETLLVEAGDSCAEVLEVLEVCYDSGGLLQLD